MKQATGECRFCGQMVTVCVDDNATQEETDKEASSTCGCDGAQEQARKEGLTADTEAGLDELMGLEESPEKCLFKMAIPLLVNERIKSVGISLEGNLTYKMSIKDRHIACERKKVITDRTEA